jgi:hypothetical protein
VEQPRVQEVGAGTPDLLIQMKQRFKLPRKPALQLLRKWWKPVLQEFVKGVAKGLGLYFIAHLLR